MAGKHEWEPAYMDKDLITRPVAQLRDIELGNGDSCAYCHIFIHQQYRLKCPELLDTPCHKAPEKVERPEVPNEKYADYPYQRKLIRCVAYLMKRDEERSSSEGVEDE
jgi:hypothetical protein